MLYRVLVDGKDILDYDNPKMVLLTPTVEMEVNTAGSFEFVIPPTHKYYTKFTMDNFMKKTVFVYEGNVLHFVGRPIEIHQDFYNNKKVYCEGALGYFNDTVYRKFEANIQLHAFFKLVIKNHNDQVTDPDRKFTVGRITVKDKLCYRKIDNEQTWDILSSKCLDAEDGYFFVRYSGGKHYIDWLKDFPYSCNQTVKFAKNLLNFTHTFDAKELATCVIPLGKNDEKGNPLTLKGLIGSEVLVGAAASKYGRIIKVQTYGDISNVSELLAEAQKYLSNSLYNATQFECAAVDMNPVESDYDIYHIGQKVKCKSDPHSLSMTLPLSKLTLNLDTSTKQISLGRITRKNLSRFYKIESKNNSNNGLDNVENENDPWELVPPDEDNDNPTMKRVPIGIRVTTPPHSTEWETGDEISYNGIVVKAVADVDDQGTATWFHDEHYPNNPTDGIPFEELSFEPEEMPEGEVNVTAWVTWAPSVYNRTYVTSFTLTNTTEAEQQAANEAQHGGRYPDHIIIQVPPSKLVYDDGEDIDYSGIIVYAYWPNGDIYSGDGEDTVGTGNIPHSELIFPVDTASTDQTINTGKRKYSGGGITAMAIDTSNSVTSGSNTYYYGPELGTDGLGRPCSVTTGSVSATLYITKYEGHIYIASASGETRFDLMSYNSETGKWTLSGGSSARAGDGVFTSGSWDQYLQGIPESSVNPIGKSISDLTYQGDMGAGTQIIPVQWVAPGGATLEDTFEITVRATETSPTENDGGS